MLGGWGGRWPPSYQNLNHVEATSLRQWEKDPHTSLQEIYTRSNVWGARVSVSSLV